MSNLEKAKKLINYAKKNQVTYICNVTKNNNTIDVANTYTINSGEKAKVKNIGNNKNALLEFYIPKGDTGLNQVSAANIVTFEDNYPKEGYEIKELEKVPLTRIELDTNNVCTLDKNLIKLNKAGYYEISFTVNGYVNTTLPFDETKDFISLGFREENTDNVYIGSSIYITDSTSKNIFAQGLLQINDVNKTYELVNLSKRSIYLKTPALTNINTNSYFVNSPVNIIIRYLGK